MKYALKIAVENIGLEKLQLVCYKFYGKVMWKDNTKENT